MANSDIENYAAEFGSSALISASNAPGPVRELKSSLSIARFVLSSALVSASNAPGPIQELKSSLSIARQGRAPLESSNTSNCVLGNNSQVLHAAATNKTLQEGRDGRAAPTGQFSRTAVDGGQPCGEVFIDDVRSRQRRWDMLSARLNQDDGTYSLFHDASAAAAALGDSEFDRQAVEAVQDSFRQLCAPRQLDRSNFFGGIIDVDRELGFGEDEAFERLQNEGGSDSCKSSESRPCTSYGKRSAEEGGNQGHVQGGFGVNFSNRDLLGGEGPELVMRENHRKFTRRSSSIEASGRGRCCQIEEFMTSDSLPVPEFRRSFSNEYLHFSSQEQNGTLNSESAELEVSADYEDPGNKKWMPGEFDSEEEEGMHMESREREWETESRDVARNDEEVGMWKEKVRIEEQERNRSDAGQDYTLQSEPENMEEAIQDMLAEMRQENSVQESEESIQEEELERTIRNRTTDNNDNPYSLVFFGFEDLLRESDGKAERVRKTVEDVVRVKEEIEEAMIQQQLGWSETEKRMQSRLNSLETQHSRLLDTLRETESILTSEKERRQESRAEVDRILEMLKKERTSHKETVEKLSTCVNSLMKLRGDLAAQKSQSAEEEGPSYLQVVDTVLEHMDRELQVNLTQWSEKSSEVEQHSSDIDELSRWKQQRDALEEERDKAEEKMVSLLKRTRERHGEMEALWLERETLLEQKVGCLEVGLQHSETRQRRKEAEILAERVRCAEELQKHRKAWARERIAWEATVRGREERLAIDWDCIPQASEDNRLAIVEDSINEGLIEDSSAASEYSFKDMEAKALQDVATKGRSSSPSKISTFDDKVSQFCVDVGNLALGIETGVERATEDLRVREHQWEMEKMEWKELEERYKKERQEMETRISDSTALMEELKMEIASKEAEMEGEKKQRQALLMQKATEVEKLSFQLKSKEHDMEVTVQKLMDEVRLIDKEVEKERKEREQVMELHFASKRKVVTDMKEREERWDKEIESMKQEVAKAKMEMRHKEKAIEELKGSSARAPSDRERQLTRAVSTLQHEKDALAAELFKEKGEVRRAMEKMLADVWKVCEEEQIQAAVAKKLGPGEELCIQRPMWEFLWLEYCRNKGINDNEKYVEWESVVGEIARFKKEMSEAKTMIETLRDELKLKDDQILQAKEDTETSWEEREKDWAKEREKLTKLVEGEQSKGSELGNEWKEREQELIREKEEIERSYKMQQSESAEAISNLQGVVRELEWVLKQSKSPDGNHEHEASIIRRGLIQPATKNSNLVKVHASYLEEVDRYILELEAAEKKLRTPERVLDRKWAADPEMNLALMKIERDLFSSPDSKGYPNNNSSVDAERGYFSPHGSRDWDMPGGGFTSTRRKQMPQKRTPKTPERNMCLTLNGLATLARDAWADTADEHLPLWQLEDRSSSNSIASWMSPRSSTEDLYSSQELPAHGVLALPSGSPPTPLRRQQKWVVDVGWLEQVRKEHAWLRQQLEIERQRVAALGRVEADNRWIEAAIIRALELKRESDSKVADMQRKVDGMEVLMSKNPVSRTP